MKKFLMSVFTLFVLVSCEEASTNGGDNPTKWDKETNGKLPIILIKSDDPNNIKDYDMVRQAYYDDQNKITYDYPKINKQAISLLKVHYDYDLQKVILDTSLDKDPTPGKELFLISGGGQLASEGDFTKFPFILTSLVKGSIYYNNIINNSLVFNETFFDNSLEEFYEQISFEISDGFTSKENVLAIAKLHLNSELPYKITNDDIIVNFDQSKIEKNTLTVDDISFTNGTINSTFTYNITYVEKGATYQDPSADASDHKEEVTTPHLLITYTKIEKK